VIRAKDSHVEGSNPIYVRGKRDGLAAGEIPPIHTPRLNAPYLEFEQQTWTKGGLDSIFVASYPGHLLLTLLFLQRMDRDTGRVVVIASSANE
jgi:hypothetical protein